MKIPDEAVEAAAIVLGTTRNGDPIVTVRLDDLGDLVGTTPEYWMSQARAALEAAAPLLMAQALREMAAKRWVCEVVESGYHNGARCSAADPHAGWNCGYFYEHIYRVPADELEQS